MILKDKVYINKKELHDDLKDLCDLFIYNNPEFYQLKKLKLSTRETSEKLYHYYFDGITAEFPRGGLNKIIEFYKERNIPFRVKDERVSHEAIDVNLVNTEPSDKQYKICKVIKENETALIQSPPGCITGDSIIRFNRTKRGFSTTIEKAYKRFNNLDQINYNWDLKFETFIRSFNGETIQLHKIQDIVYSGKKEVYKLTLENGLNIKATSDHKIMTKNGWVKLIDLTYKHEVMCDTPHVIKKGNKRKKQIDKIISGVNYHPYARERLYDNRCLSKVMEYHKLVYEAYINNIDIDKYIHILQTGEGFKSSFKFIDQTKYDIHHKDFNHYNNKVENLECLLKIEYHKLHSKRDRFNFNQGIPVYSKVKSVEYAGLENTYDIICDEPYRNFNANDIIIHNSGKSISILLTISEIKQPTLILLHEHRLATQWKEEVEKRLAGNFKLGELSGDKKEHGDITIGLIQTVNRIFDKDPTQFDKYGMVAVDECLDPETVITTPTGIKKLKDINIGDEVLTPKGKAKVKDKWVTKKEAYKYKTSNGNYIIASENHLMLSQKNNDRKTLGVRPIKDSKMLIKNRSLNSYKNIPYEFKLTYKDNYKAYTIKTIEPLGKRELIDISLDDEDKLFYANGFISHNCHRASAETYVKVLNNLNAKYRVGVTGTVKRKDSKEILAYDIFGKILLDIQEKDLKERITDFEFEMINTNIEFEIPTVVRWAGGKRQSVIDYTKTITTIVDDETRNNLIFYHIQQSIQDGYFPLVLSDRVSHNEFFYNKLIEAGYKSVLIIGKTRKKVKWDEVVSDETLQCVVANTSIASEGLDLPRLSALFSTTPSSNAPKIKQRVGRIRRSHPNKLKPKVFDFVDNLAFAVTDSGRNYMLKYTARNRIKIYKELIENYSQ